MKKQTKRIIIVVAILSLFMVAQKVIYQKNEENIIMSTAEACELNVDYSILMAESVCSGNYSNGKRYENLRNEKKAYLGIKDNLNYDDLLLLSKIVYAEAGSNWLTEEHRQLVASVVLNRAKSPEFPNTISGVIYQKGQYAPVGTSYFKNIIPSRQVAYSALKVLVHGSIAPSSVVFQANFKQGSGVYKAIRDSKLGTTYFCYSNNRGLYR